VSCGWIRARSCRGELKILLLNTDRTASFEIAPGDRIAQLVLIAVDTAAPIEVDVLSTSERGVGGFGSSGGFGSAASR
jgi:dUTP pyrophosphatase